VRSPDASAQRSRVSILIALTVALLVVRLWLDAHLELMFDEAYYALWAKHLAWCYLDHPPLVALWIRLSTWCFGGNAFGVRALGTLAAAAGTGVVYLLSWHLFANRAAATLAGLLYCSMLLIAAGAIIVTPDTPLVFFWSIALYALVQIYRGNDPDWWLVVGIAMGLALQSKYTALLLGAGIPCAMLTVPRMGVWWRRPEPYLAGILAFAIFLPVVVWNYRHGWASFAKQFSRADVDGLGIRYVAEFAASQIGLLTPLVFVLAAAGCWLALSRRGKEDRDAELFLVSLIAPMMLYFLLHSLHARVHGNWIAPAYPVLAVLGAQAAFRVSEFGERMRSTIAFSRKWAVPTGVGIVAIAYLQAIAAPLPLDAAKDPTSLMAGWSRLARELEGVARREGASYILTSSYALTSELDVHSDGAIPILQFDEPMRWLSFERPQESLFSSPGLYVTEDVRDRSDELVSRFREMRRVGEVPRTRDGRLIARYVIYLVAKPSRAVLDAAE
jgi:4-amino-4-deoxy-L-arabinose transferase-like glycosyltransferase